MINYLIPLYMVRVIVGAVQIILGVIVISKGALDPGLRNSLGVLGLILLTMGIVNVSKE